MTRRFYRCSPLLDLKPITRLRPRLRRISAALWKEDVSTRVHKQYKENLSKLLLPNKEPPWFLLQLTPFLQNHSKFHNLKSPISSTKNLLAFLYLERTSSKIAFFLQLDLKPSNPFDVDSLILLVASSKHLNCVDKQLKIRTLKSWISMNMQTFTIMNTWDQDKKKIWNYES